MRQFPSFFDYPQEHSDDFEELRVATEKRRELVKATGHEFTHIDWLNFRAGWLAAQSAPRKSETALLTRFTVGNVEKVSDDKVVLINTELDKLLPLNTTITWE
jgi:hypothetical protein